MQNTLEFDQLIGQLKVDEAVNEQLTLLAKAVALMESVGATLPPNSEAVLELRTKTQLVTSAKAR
jgi:hypothetical protein